MGTWDVMHENVFSGTVVIKEKGISLSFLAHAKKTGAVQVWHPGSHL
jgi:hypothetical protein